MTSPNPLYPAFFRLDRLQLLVVGAGQVGEEKLRYILKSSPNAQVTLIAPEMGDGLRQLLEEYQRQATEQYKTWAGTQVQPPREQRADEQEVQLGNLMLDSSDGQIDVTALSGRDFTFHDTYWANEGEIGGLYLTAAGGHVMYLNRVFQPEDVALGDLVIAATDIEEVNLSVYTAAKAERRLCNIADTPELCDFYLGSIVTRGPLKVAISTNGQSPTFAKRFRQWLEAELPEEETSSLLDSLKLFRDRLTGDFRSKVRALNTLTRDLLNSGELGGRSCPPGVCLLAAAAATPQEDAPAPPPPDSTSSDAKTLPPPEEGPDNPPTE